MTLIGTPEQRASRGAAAAIVTVLLLATMLFITLLSYGVMIMRSVLDEKASRVIEVSALLGDARRIDERKDPGGRCGRAAPGGDLGHHGYRDCRAAECIDARRRMSYRSR